jgi:hypothetical protein
VDVCGDPSFTPSLCDKVQKVLCACESVLLVCDCSVNIGDYTRRFWTFFRAFICAAIRGLDWIRFRRILLEVKVCETVVLGEVIGYRPLSSADSCDFLAENSLDLGRDLAHLHTDRLAFCGFFFD